MLAQLRVGQGFGTQIIASPLSRLQQERLGVVNYGLEDTAVAGADSSPDDFPVTPSSIETPAWWPMGGRSRDVEG
jgi:hypothetical protein